MTLLYVEDNIRVLSEVKTIFKDMFASVYTLQNGVEALTILSQTHIDIIVTDIHMPHMNGLELMREIRKKDKQISIIVLTAYADRDILLEASNMQIDGYIVKPISLSKILEAFSNTIQRSNIQTYYELKSGYRFYPRTKSIQDIDGRNIELGKKESTLLELLLLNSQRVVTKEEIILYIWEIDDITDSALKNLIMNLRNKVGKESIKNIKGHGWQLLVNI